MTQTFARYTLDDWLHHLEQLHPKGECGIELGLTRVRAVAQQLQQKPFCPVITVAGTNGKGSVCALLAAIYRAAGYRVGKYTSPHLLHYRERIQIDEQAIDDSRLCAAFARVEAARQQIAQMHGDASLTYFEFGTLAAWEIFAQAHTDVMILEVGLGGRLDAVNVYEPDVAILTSVAFDHCQWLGNDLDAIGHEKAGIFRAHKPALCAETQPPASVVAHAEAIGAQLLLRGRDFGFCLPIDSQEARQKWQWWLADGDDCADDEGQRKHITRRDFAFPALRGSQQLINASVVLTAVTQLQNRLPLTMQAMREGLANVQLPGRFQVLPGRPVRVLDVAHNPAATAVLCSNLNDLGFFPRNVAVVGMLADKDIAAALRVFAGKIDVWYLCPLPSPRSESAENLAAIIQQNRLGGIVHCCPDVASAWQQAESEVGENDRIAAFGSFYTVAGVWQALQPSAT